MSIDVEVLVQDHKQMLDTIDGLEIHTEPGLIAQLREAIYGGNLADGVHGKPSSKMPIQAAAYDEYVVIDRQISEAWVDAFQRVPNADRTETLLAQWAAHVTPETYVPSQDAYARDLVSRWERKIRDYLDPPRLAEIKAPCLSCGERWVWRTKDDQRVRSSALSFRRDRRTGETLDAECAACGVVWMPDRFEWLAEHLGQTTSV